MPPANTGATLNKLRRVSLRITRAEVEAMCCFLSVVEQAQVIL